MNKLYNKILKAKFIPKTIGVLIVIFINWLFQSLLYMGITEKILKIFIDLVLFLGFFVIFNNITNFISAIVISFIIAHTLNWIFNGHIFALLKTFGNIKTETEEFSFYLDNLKNRSTNESSILLVATFGSMSRKELKKTSDLDIRVIRKEGFNNALRSSFFVLFERSNAFFNKFPLDIYLCDNIDCIEKLKEPPVPVYDPNQLLK